MDIERGLLDELIRCLAVIDEIVVKFEDAGSSRAKIATTFPSGFSSQEFGGKGMMVMLVAQRDAWTDARSAVQ